jgi:hypothetical protein
MPVENAQLLNAFPPVRRLDLASFGDVVVGDRSTTNVAVGIQIWIIQNESHVQMARNVLLALRREPEASRTRACVFAAAPDATGENASVERALFALKDEFSDVTIAVVSSQESSVATEAGEKRVDVGRALEAALAPARTDRDPRWRAYAKGVRDGKINLGLFLATRQWDLQETILVEGRVVPTARLFAGAAIFWIDAVKGMILSTLVVRDVKDALDRLWKAFALAQRAA